MGSSSSNNAGAAKSARASATRMPPAAHVLVATAVIGRSRSSRGQLRGARLERRRIQLLQSLVYGLQTLITGPRLGEDRRLEALQALHLAV